VFERALARNGVGPLAEEYDVKHERMVGRDRSGSLAAPLDRPVKYGPRSRPQPCLPVEVAVPLGRVMAWSRGMPADLDALCPSAIVPSGLAHP